MHAREADLLIAPVVEKYPILYFPLIPIEFLIMLIIVKVLTWVAVKLFGKWLYSWEQAEKIVLSGSLVYWIIGNSSANLVYLLGFRIPGAWLKTTLIAIPITLIFVLYLIRNTVIAKAAQKG